MKAEYTKENTSPFTVAEMLGLFRNHEIVTFTIKGVGETCAETVLFRDALERLATECQSPETQRLLEIGRATEKAFEYGGMPSLSYLTLAELWPDGTAYDPIELYSVEELLEWRRAQEVQRESD